MGIFEIALLIGALVVGAGLGIAGLVFVASNRPQVAPLEPSDLSAPRASQGEVLPFILGTAEQRTCLTVYQGPVTRGDPYFREQPGQPNDHLLVQYRCTLDMVICERLWDRDGNAIGEVRLRKIWYGDNLLWEHSPFHTGPVNSSGTLLDHDPVPGIGNPGGVYDVYTRGSYGWWYGGCMGDRPGPNPPGPAGSEVIGPLLGDWIKEGTEPYGPWTKGYGMERVRFYAGQTGTEVENVQIRTELGYPEDQHYPSYPKLVRIVFENFVWGPESHISDISVELTHTCPAPEIGDTTGLMPDGLNVNPISVLYQILNSPDFSATKLPPCNIDSFSAARAVIEAEGLGMTFRLNASNQLKDLAKSIMDLVDGIWFEHRLTGEICIALNRKPTYEPLLFDQSHTIGVKDVSKTTWEAAHSQVRISYEQLGMAGNGTSAKSVAVAKDPGLSESQGGLESLDEDSSVIFDRGVASQVAANKLSMVNTPLVKMSASFNRLPSLNDDSRSMLDVNIGEVIAWRFPDYDINDRIYLRVLDIDYGELDSNGITIEAIQDKYLAPNFVAPPEQPDTFGPPVLADAEISTYEIITAPYWFAKRGLGSDARRTLTTAPLYHIDSDTAGDTYAVNYDRFLVLVKRPYAQAVSFVWELFKSDGPWLEGKTVPYTDTAVLNTLIAATVGDADGVVPSIELANVSSQGIWSLTSRPCFLMIGTEFFQTASENVTIDGSTVTITDVWREILDSPRATASHSIDDLVWILEQSEDWALARLSNLYASCREEYYEFSADGPPADGDFNDFQTLTFEAYSILQNIDSSRRNIALQTDAQFLDDRANRLLPVRKFDLASTSASASSAATSFTFDFEQLGGGVPRLYQMREFSPEPGFMLDLLLPPESSSGLASVEMLTGILTDALEADNRHISGLTVWYEYLTGPLAGVVREAAFSEAGSGVVSFLATAEATTRSVRCYVRNTYAPHVLGDAGRVPIRHSRPRVLTILLTRT